MIVTSTVPGLGFPHEPSEPGSKGHALAMLDDRRLTFSLLGAFSDFLSFYGKLANDFSHESDVTSLQDLCTSRPSKNPFYFTIVFPVKKRRDILFQRRDVQEVL